MKILIIKLGALGDVVRTSYFLRGLRVKCGGNLHITWVTSPKAVALLEFHPDVDRLWSTEDVARDPVGWHSQQFDWVISLDDEVYACGLLEGLKWARLTGACLEEGKVNYTLDAAPWFDMGLISKLGKARADGLKLVNQRTHDVIFGGILGIRVAGPEFHNRPGAAEDAIRILSGQAGYFTGLNLSAGNRWLNKRLGPAQAELLVVKLKLAGVPMLLLGGVDDVSYNRRLAECSGCPVLPPVSLNQFAAVVGQLKAIITADTLAMHLAIAQRIPSVSFFAPTSAAEINTFSTGLKIRSTTSDYCNYKSDADNSSITAERLFEAFEKLAGMAISTTP